jgi:hypothetical protein
LRSERKYATVGEIAAQPRIVATTGSTMTDSTLPEIHTFEELESFVTARSGLYLR